jgi:hypothetical protein
MPKEPTTDLASITDSSLATTFSGILYKKRRKKLQGKETGEPPLIIGYAKRYFTLSVVTGELSYSLSSHNPMLRGTIPLALAALNIDYGRREFILDSGSDIWHLKASNENEFEIWKTRLEGVWLKAVAGRKKSLQDQEDGHEISTEWKQVEGLVDRLAMMKDFVCGIVQDIAHEGSKSTHSLNLKKSVDNLRDIKSKDAKGMKIFRKKDKPSPPASPRRELSINSLQLHGMTFQCMSNVRQFPSRDDLAETGITRSEFRIHINFLSKHSIKPAINIGRTARAETVTTISPPNVNRFYNRRLV